MKKVYPFKFRQFACDHSRSSMKIGVDAVLIGAWCFPAGGSVLDAGCGCGVISLMMAQRNNRAKVTAIDIDAASVEEAAANFAASPWPERLSAARMDFRELPESGRKFDLIVSNPPFFDSGIVNPESARLMARHQGGLSPFSLVESASTLLAEGGRLAFICPSEFEERLCGAAAACGLRPLRICRVSGRTGAAPKRVMMELGAGSAGMPPEVTSLSIETAPGCLTPEYRALTKDFYIK